MEICSNFCSSFLLHQFLTLFFLLNQGGRRRAAQSSTTPATPGTPGNATILVESAQNVIAGPTEHIEQLEIGNWAIGGEAQKPQFCRFSKKELHKFI